MATIYIAINDPDGIDPFQARIFADDIDVHDSVFVRADPAATPPTVAAFSPPHILRPCTTFQWFKDDVAIDPTVEPQAITDVYQVLNNDVANSGTYYCRISIGDVGEDGEPTPACIVEETERRTIAIIDCGQLTHSIPAAGATVTSTVVHPNFVSIGSLSVDAVPSWITGSAMTTTVDNVSTSVYSFVIAASQAGRKTYATLPLGGFDCIYAFTQDFVNARPPVRIEDPAEGPAIFRVLNDGPAGVAENCVTYRVSYDPGSYGLNYVSCIGESSFRGFGAPSTSTVESRTIDITAEMGEAGRIEIDDFDVRAGRITGIEVVPSTNSAEGRGVVIINPFGGVYDANGMPDTTVNIADFLFLFSVGLTLIPRTAISEETGVTVIGDNGTSAIAYHLFDDVERPQAPGEINAPIVIIATAEDTFPVTISLTTPDLQTVIATEVASFIGTAAARTNGVVSGETTGSVECGRLHTLDGTFRVESGTANVYFETAGVPIGFNSSDPNFLTQSSDFEYQVSGNGVDVSGLIPATGNSLRRNNNLGLNELAVGTYSWTIRFDPDQCFEFVSGGRSFGGALGRITAEGNVFF